MILLVRKCTVSLSSLTLTRHNYSLPFQTLLFSSSANVPVSTADFLTNEHHISPETALKASSTISHLKNPNRTDSVLSCLKQTGFSAPQIEQMINRYPKILNASPETVKKKLRVFQDKGFSTLDTVHIVSKNPRVLHLSIENHVQPSIDALKSALGSTEAVCRVLKKLAWFPRMDLSKSIIPNMEFMKKRFELSSCHVAKYLVQYPGFFLLRPETIDNGVRRLDEMGLKCSSKMYVHALRVVCSTPEEKLKLKMSFFQGLGLSENEVIQMLKRFPLAFWYSEEKIYETMEVLLGSGKADPLLPLKLVGLLSFSLEKRIKPRLQVVKALEDSGLLSKKFSLYTILMMTNKKFMERFVLSNSKALGDECVIGITKKLALDSAV